MPVSSLLSEANPYYPIQVTLAPQEPRAMSTGAAVLYRVRLVCDTGATVLHSVRVRPLWGTVHSLGTHSYYYTGQVRLGEPIDCALLGESLPGVGVVNGYYLVPIHAMSPLPSPHNKSYCGREHDWAVRNYACLCL